MNNLFTSALAFLIFFLVLAWINPDAPRKYGVAVGRVYGQVTAGFEQGSGEVR